MTTERTLAILRAEADNAAAAVVKGLNDRIEDKELKLLKKALAVKTDNLNAAVAKAYYQRMAAECGKNAVLEMIKAKDAAVPGVIKYQVKAGEDGIFVATPKEAKMQISLTTIRDTIGKEYFHADDWFQRTSNLARLIAVQVNKNLEGTPEYKYIIDEAAEKFELGEGADPTSKTSMVKAFQKVIDGIVFVGENDKNDIKFTSKDWNFLRESFTFKGREINEVGTMSPLEVIGIVVNVIHCILNGKKYVTT